MNQNLTELRGKAYNSKKAKDSVLTVNDVYET